jgi:hypothetical protein
VLVGVEYALPLAVWVARDPANKDPANPPPQGAAVPSVDGHQMSFMAQPNRFGIPNMFYLHLWAWRYNPDGLSLDWNRTVTCTKQSVSRPPVSPRACQAAARHSSQLIIAAPVNLAPFWSESTTLPKARLQSVHGSDEYRAVFATKRDAAVIPACIISSIVLWEAKCASYW